MAVPSMIRPISRTIERFLQYAQNMRAVTWKNAGRCGADNGQYTCGFSHDRPMFPTKFMQWIIVGDCILPCSAFILIQTLVLVFWICCDDRQGVLPVR
jgi:hypothetical protein